MAFIKMGCGVWKLQIYRSQWGSTWGTVYSFGVFMEGGIYMQLGAVMRRFSWSVPGVQELPFEEGLSRLKVEFRPRSGSRASSCSRSCVVLYLVLTKASQWNYNMNNMSFTSYQLQSVGNLLLYVPGIPYVSLLLPLIVTHHKTTKCSIIIRFLCW